MNSNSTTVMKSKNRWWILFGALTLAANGPATAAQPGQKLWEFPIPNHLVLRDCRVEAAPAIGGDGTVYVAAIWQICAQSWNNCGDVGSLYALTGATGEKLWESSDVVRSGPAIGPDGRLYAPSFQRIPGPTISWLAARNITTGQEAWNVSTRPFEPSAPAVAADGMVYVSVTDMSFPGHGKVYALDGRDGHTAWEFPANSGWISAPVVGAGGVVYVGCGDVGGTVYALAGATGQKLWESVTGGYVSAWAAIGSDGTVYVGSSDGKLNALDGATGQIRWDFLTGGAVRSSPAISPDGTVYVGSHDAKVYAVSSSSVGGLARSPWPKFRGDARNTGRVSPPAPVTLRISRQEEKVRIEWPPPGILQSTAELAPAAWQDVAGATSPYDVEPANAQRFYRLRQPRRRHRRRGDEPGRSGLPCRPSANLRSCGLKSALPGRPTEGPLEPVRCRARGHRHRDLPNRPRHRRLHAGMQRSPHWRRPN